MTLLRLRNPPTVASAGAGSAVLSGKVPSVTEGGGVPAGLVFASEWDTGTGTGSDALRDTGRARPWSGVDSNCEVRVTATDGRDYPTENYLRFQADGGADHIAVNAASGYWSALAVGEYFFLRYYRQDRVPNTEDDSDGTHGDYIDTALSGGDGWGPYLFGLYPRHDTDGTFKLRVSAGADQADRYWVTAAGDPSGPNDSTSYDKFTTYRYELRYSRVSTTEYRLGMRIYDVNDALLFDVDDWRDMDPFSGDATTADRLSTWTFTTDRDTSRVTGFKLGINSFVPINDPPFDFVEYAAVAAAVSTDADDWLGPYTAAEKSWSP